MKSAAPIPQSAQRTRVARGARPSAAQASSRGGATPAVEPTNEAAKKRGPTAELRVRPALAGDLAPLEFFFDTLLRRDYFLRRGQLREMLGGAHHRAWVAEIDSVLVGIAVATAGCRLVNVLVHPAYRGLGIGRALVVASGASEVRVKTDMTSGDPRDFYRALGFASTGEFNAKRNIEVMRVAIPPRQRGATGGANERKVKS